MLCQETEPIENIILVKSGWVRRVRGVPLDPASTSIAVGIGQTIGADFLGAGNCLGLEGAGEQKTWKYSASVMARIAKETGGADFNASEKGLSHSFQLIGEELRSSYRLAYHSTNTQNDDSFRKVRIRVKREGYTVRAKTGYYAR